MKFAMKFTGLVAASAMMVLLAGCAGSISQPTALTAMSSEQLKTIHIATISADSASDVPMTNSDYNNICDKVRAYIKVGSPDVLVDAATGETLTMKMHFTRYDKGSAFARFMLIGLGQIHIDATVTLVRADGSSAGEYKVKKTFALGGIAGGMTRIEDVEDGFAKSVAEIVKTKVAS